VSYTEVFSNRFTVVVDACVLADVAKRDLILTLAEAGLFRLRWSDTILREAESAIRSICRERGDADERAARAIAAMQKGFPDAIEVGGDLVEISPDFLPDADDVHVLKTTIACKADMIITDNVKDFPADKLAPYQIEVRSADDFIADTIDLDYLKSIPAIRAMREKLGNPAMTAAELLERWISRGMTSTAEIMAPHIQNI
jgi:predicted nucleic acid-binding protein